MAFRHFDLPDLGQVTVYKRRGARKIRLSIRADDTIRVTIPYWVSFAAGLQFVKQKSEWLLSTRPGRVTLTAGMRIGKAHKLVFEATEAARVSSRLKDSEISIKFPATLDLMDAKVQKVAQNASIRALKAEANTLLPQRLRQLADKHGFVYRNVGIKHLKSRWGSCSSHHDITLNCFLMQLPWREIDYVLLHELTHTKHLSHNQNFWQTLRSVCPAASEIRKEIAKKQPTFNSID